MGEFLAPVSKRPIDVPLDITQKLPPMTPALVDGLNRFVTEAHIATEKDLSRNGRYVSLPQERYDFAREAYGDVRIHIKSSSDKRAVQGFLWRLPQEERPLLMTTDVASTLKERYGLPSGIYGERAFEVLGDIASGVLPGKAELRDMPTPMGDIIEILSDTFGSGTAQEVLIDAAYARKERITSPRRGTSQDIDALQDAVGLLPLFTGESVAEAIVDIASFADEISASDSKYADLFTMNVLALWDFVNEPDNTLFLVGQGEKLNSLLECVKIDDRKLSERKIIEQSLGIISEAEAGIVVRPSGTVVRRYMQPTAPADRLAEVLEGLYAL